VTGPDFRELVGDDLPEQEAARLRRVHELLVEAGPPPELPPSLANGPAERISSPALFHRRRRLGAALLIAAAVALVAFGGGYLLGNHNTGFTAKRAIAMHATTAGASAGASLKLAREDKAGNWPIRMAVRGLPDLGTKGYYELYLTRDGRQVASCGTFVVGGQTTVVQLNAPYLLPPGAKDGWVVVAHHRAAGDSPVLLTT
jgi:hypothetical protein